MRSSDHSGTASDVALGDRAAGGGVERLEYVARFHVKSVYVVERAVVGFGDHGQRPPVAALVGSAVLHTPLDHGIAHDSHTVGVCDHDGTFEKAGLLHPGGAGHLTVAVKGGPAGENGIAEALVAAREDGGDSRADGALADDQLAGAGYQRGKSDFDARDVSDGVEGPRSAVEWDAEIAGTRLGGRCCEGDGGNHDESE